MVLINHPDNNKEHRALIIFFPSHLPKKNPRLIMMSSKDLSLLRWALRYERDTGEAS